MFQTILVLTLEYVRNTCTCTWSIPWLLMPWLLMSLGHQQPWYWLCKTETWGRSLSPMWKDFNYSTCIISAYRNYRKCKYTYIIYVALEQTLAKGSLQEMLASTQTALQRVVAHHSCPVGGFSHFWLQQGEPGDCGNTQDSSSLHCRLKSGVLNIIGTCKTSFLNSEMVQHCRWMKFFPMEGKDQPILYDGCWCPEN